MFPAIIRRDWVDLRMFISFDSGVGSIPIRATTRKEGDFVAQTALPNTNERVMIKRRGLNPSDYFVVKRLNYTIILKHRVTGMLKFMDKRS